MFVYILLDKRGVVKDFDHNTDPDAEWKMKRYDDVQVNEDLEKQGYIKAYLTSSWFQSFETYYDLFTFVDGSLRLPTNIPQPTNDMIMAQLNNQDYEFNKLRTDTAQMKTIIKKLTEGEAKE